MKGIIRQAQGPIARGTLRTSFVLGLRLIVQAGTLLLVARMLGPQQFGAFAGVAALAVMLGTLATFGMQTILLGEVSKEPARRTKVLPYAIPTTLIGGSALLIVYLAICTFALREAGVSRSVLVAIGATEMLLQPLLVLSAMEHLGLGRIARSQLLQTLPLSLRLAAAASVFLLAPTDPLVVYGYGYCAASVLALGIAAVTMPAPWPVFKLWRLPTGAQLRGAAGYAVLNITATGPAELDKTLATKLLPLAASGLYAAGARVIGATTLPVIAMLLSSLPRLFREGQDQPNRTAQLLRWIFTAAFGYSVALAVLLWSIAPIFVWLFGPKYHGIEHTIHWLTLAVPGMALRMAAGSVLTALARPWMRVGFEVIGLVVLGVAAVVLIPRLGVTGMPLALICSEWGMTIVGGALILGMRQEPRTNPTLCQGERHETKL